MTFRILLLSIFLIGNLTAAQWFWQNPMPQGNQLFDVSFSDANNGTAVGDWGTILRTTNGGVEWTVQSSGTTERLYGVYFTDENFGIGVGLSGTILRTTNGGTTWTKQTSGTTRVLLGVYFTDINEGTVVGNSGVILKTTNGGSTWIQQISGTTNSLYDVCFVDSNNGTIVGFLGTILRTTNGGTTWTEQTSGTTNALLGVSFSDINNGTAVGWQGTIIRTTDGGENWISQTSGTTQRLEDVFFIDVNNGTVVGWNGRIFKTTNGGTTWTRQIPTFQILNGVCFTDANIGTAVGMGGIIIRTTNGGTTWIKQTEGTNNYLRDVFFSDTDNGTAVGSVGTIVRTTNGGITWTEQTSGTTDALSGICFTDASNGTVVGYAGMILRTTNSGSTWATQISGTANSLYDVSFSDANNGYIVGFEGIIIRTTDGGITWAEQTSGTTNNLNSVSFTDANNGAAVGDGGTILKTTNGGTEWISQISGTLVQLNGVSFTDANNGTVVSGDGRILRTTDGGNTWIQQLNYFGGLNAVSFVDANIGVAVGWNGLIGLIFRTTDGGANWTEQISGTTERLNGIFFTDANNGTAVGSNGTILRTTNGGGTPVTTLQLRFPILNETPSSVWMTAILDHVNSPYRQDKTQPFVDFLNERGGETVKEWAWSKHFKLWYAFRNSSQDPYLPGYDYNDDKLWYLGHPGNDYGISYGTEIYAVAPGKVSYPDYIGYQISRKYTARDYAVLAIDHRPTPGTGSGYISYFFHLSTHPDYEKHDTDPPIAQEGDIITQAQVDAGLVIGRSGSTSAGKKGVTGKHLHYELHWVNAEGKHIIVDPYGWYPNDSTIDPLFTNSYNNGGDDRPESDKGKWLWLDPRPISENNIPISNFVQSRNMSDFQSAESLLWEQKISNTTEPLFDVDFPSSTTGYAIGDDGTVLKTTNSGDQWQPILTAPINDHQAVYFTSETYGFLVSKNMILQTSDGGNSWTKRWLIPSQSSLYDTLNNFVFLQDIFFPSQDVGYISGAYLNSQNVSPVFFKTTDSGLTWTAIADYFATGNYDEKYIQSSYFQDYSIGFVILYSIEYPQSDSASVIDSIQILKTTDGGLSWYEGIEGSLSDYCSDITFINQDTGYVFGSGVLFKTTNGSANIPSWTSDSLFPGTIKGLCKFSDGFVGVGLNGNIIFSHDGTSWWTEDSGTPYHLFSINSRSGVVCAVGDSGTILIRKNASSLSVSVEDGWNMVSVPGIHPVDQNVTTWWSGKDPGASVFKYTGGYVAVTTTTPTEGYWMKNAGAQVYNYPAIEIVAHNDVPLALGWNLIGLYETTVPTAGLTTNPPGIITTPIFEYSGGYTPATDIEPGYGYWAKADVAGSITGLSAPPLGKGNGEVVELFPEDWGKIILSDASGINYTLYAVTGEVNLDKYELPPLPPQGMFDIRFSSGRIAEDINSSIQTIDMSGVTYPLTVSVDGMDMRLMDETGSKVNVNLKSGEDVVISDATIQKLKVTEELLPAVYALEQNYPNPFNPNTIINFALRQDSKVNLAVFNVLGEKVVQLADQEMKAGYHQIEFDASQFASGVYLYRIKAGDFIQTKKMVLIK